MSDPTPKPSAMRYSVRSEEHTSELQSLRHLVCRLLLEKKKHSHKKRLSLDGGGSRRLEATGRENNTNNNKNNVTQMLEQKIRALEALQRNRERDQSEDD